MRIRNMKNVCKKLGVFALAFVLTVQMTGGWWPVVVKAASAPKDGFEIKAYQDGKLVTDSKAADANMPSLEIGDTLTLEIKYTGDAALTKVGTLTGALVLTDNEGKILGAGAKGCFKEIQALDYTVDPKLNMAKEVYSSGLLPVFTLTSRDNLTVIEKNDCVLKITLEVTRAINRDLKISFQGSDKKDSLVEIVHQYSAGPRPEVFKPMQTQVTNKYYYDPDTMKHEDHKRKVSFSIVGNSRQSGNDSIDVPIKPTKTKKTRIAVRVNKDNDGKRIEPGYSGFTLSYTYNPKYLRLDTKDNKEIFYELSEEVGKDYRDLIAYKPGDPGTEYEQAVEASTIGNGTRRTVSVSFLSATKDINVYGDFLYLTFVPVDNLGKDFELGRQDPEANVTVTVSDGVNYSGTDMMTVVDGRDGEWDNDANTYYGTHTFAVNLVENLIKFGDVNDDTYINLIDALLVMQDSNGVRDLTADERERANADDSVDEDGKPTISLQDVRLILLYIHGQITELPVSASSS